MSATMLPLPGPADLEHESPNFQPDRAVVAHDLTKTFETEGSVVRAVNQVNFRVAPGDRLGILGSNGAGKSTLIKLIAGFITPTSGYVHRGLSMSWPLALGGAVFDGELTGYDNIRFVSRLYRLNYQDVAQYVADFSELTRVQLRMPVRYYSDGMRMRLAFSLTLCVDFECLLIDEVIVVGDRRFQQKCITELFERRPERAIILAVHAHEVVTQYCDRVLVMKQGRARVFDDVHHGAKIYTTL